MNKKTNSRPFRIIEGVKDRKILKGSVIKEEYDSEFTSFKEPIIDDDTYCLLFHEPEEGDGPDEQYISICTEKHFINQTFGLMAMWALGDFDDFISKVPQTEKSVNSVIEFLTMNEMFEEIVTIKEKYKNFKVSKSK